MIKYRAVHERAPWRKVSIHKSLASAIDGRDGAKRLLLRQGRVGKKWEDYGAPACVFVWDDESSADGYVFRLVAGRTDKVESTHVTKSDLERLERQRSCSVSELDKFFKLEASTTAPIYADELSDDREYLEGLAKKVYVNAYERDDEARNACIAHYGACCQVCGVDFGERYGSIGQGFIHVHHLTPISSVGSEYKVNPVRDLRPVCPNCHAMLHARKPPDTYTLEELKKYMDSE